jgi:hypothetical protein
MKQLISIAICSVMTVTLAATSPVAAQQFQLSSPCTVYSEDFEADHSSDGTWIINSVGGYNPVDLHFDYSTVGIPPAPHSLGGTTFGLKLQANLEPAVQQFPSGSSASPVGFGVPENFEMRWDWWINYNGPLTPGGSGSTQVAGGGFGTAATSAQAAGATIDSIYVAASGEASGTAADYRIYSPAFQASYQDGSGVYAAPDFFPTPRARNNLNPYYQTTFPPVSAPAAQLALYPQQSGFTQGGSAGMAWHDVSLKKIGNIVTYSIDGLLIATIDVTASGALGGDKIVFGHFDINAFASLDPNAPALAFSLVDNVRVTDLCFLSDSQPPTIVGPADTCVVSDAGSCFATGVNLETPQTSDNCCIASVANNAPASFPLGVTTVTWTVTDAAGNSATCEQKVTVVSSVSITWLPPMAGQPVANKIHVGQVVPHKVDLRDCTGALPSGVTVRLKVQGIQQTGLGEIIFQDVAEDASGTGLDGTMANDGIMVLRDGHYQFNLDTANFSDPNTLGEADRTYRSTVIVIDDSTGCELGRSSIILETRQ